MTATARLLCVIGSGETSPTMLSVHAHLMARAGSPPGPAVMLDTPYGFQENADAISARARAYFRIKLGRPLDVASLRDRETAEPIALERVYNQLREARYVFAGPGSPSYALRQWRRSRVPDLLAGHLAHGGCVTFASAAAITLGSLALPVYEIYKVGEPTHWLQGLDLLRPLGLDLVVLPHYDNTEGGTHDTRYCYMGPRRMAQLERQLPHGVSILGVAEHTAAVFDLDADTLEVRGRGFVAVRRNEVERRFDPGTPIALDQLRRGSVGQYDLRAAAPAFAPGNGGSRSHAGDGSAVEIAEARRRQFERTLARSDFDAAVATLLDLDARLAGWTAEGDSRSLERARSIFRGMLVRLGEVLRRRPVDPQQLIAPFVELALRLRDDARRHRRWTDADLVREALAELRVEVRDTPSGPEWSLPGSGRID